MAAERRVRVRRRPASTGSLKLQCCVCFGSSTTSTPCGHPLCIECWDSLPRSLCPLCRRDLPSSGGALPARCCQRERDHNGAAVETSARVGLSEPFSPELLRMRLYSKLQPLPRKLGKQVTDAITNLQTNQDDLSKLTTLLACDASLVDASVVASRDVASPRAISDAIACVRRTLSETIARQITQSSLEDVLVAAPPLCIVLRNQPMAQRAVGTMLQRSIESIVSCDRLLAWRDVKVLACQLVTLRENCEFCPMVDDVAPQLAIKIFEAVQRASLEQLPASLQQAVKLLDAWPRAAQEANVLLRGWIPGVLTQQATRCAQGPKRTFNIMWWIELLRIVAARGLLEHAGFRDICDLLAPGFADAGVRTKSTSSWSTESLGLVVVRQLAAALDENPKGIQLLGQNLLFDCPEDFGALVAEDRQSLAQRRSQIFIPLALPMRSDRARMARTLSSVDFVVSPTSSNSTSRRSASFVDLPLSPSRRSAATADPLSPIRQS